MRCSHRTQGQGLGRVAARLAALVFLFAACAALVHAQLTPAGTTISNRVQVSYIEPTGLTVTTESPVVTVLVSGVNGVAVTPDETAPNGFVDANTRVTARFSICNTGNLGTSYVVSDAAVSAPSQIESVYLDLDDSGTVTAGDTAVTLNVTATLSAAPSACIPALVVYQVGDAPAQSQSVTTLTARAADETAGRAEDTGTVRRTVRERPRFTNPTDPNLPPLKLVNGVEEVVASPSQVVTFDVAFRNSGETTALAVRVTDLLPEGLTYVPGSLRRTVGNQTASLTDARDGDDGEAVGQSVEVRFATLARDEVVSLSFGARVEPLPAGSVLINRAVVRADNAPEATSSPARVIVSPQGKVFDGAAGQSAAVRANLRVVSGSSQGAPVALTADAGFVPNRGNANPFDTGADGMYSFRIEPPSQPQTFFLLCAASDYRSRVIQVNVWPEDRSRYGVTLTALDGQPLAVYNGFGLTEQPVSFSALGAFAWNVPMFSTGGLEISKTVDRAAAEIGDVLTYRVEVRNTLKQLARGVVITDTLPQSFYFVPGTSSLELNGRTTAIEPEVTGDVLTFRLPDIPSGATAALVYRVRIGANARLGQQFNVAVGCHGGQCTPPTRVPVVVRGGIFSNSQLLVGRVFIDRNGDALFDGGDLPVAGARLIASNGYTVITDAAGNYSYPVLGDGALSVELDKASVPEGFVPRDDRRANGSQWSRLLSTPLQRGALLQSSFPLVPASPDVSAPELPSPAPSSAADSKQEAAPSVEVRKPKKRSIWSKLAFWRRGGSRPSSVNTTVILPGGPCPPEANASQAAKAAPTQVRVEVSSPSSTYSAPAPAAAPQRNDAPPVLPPATPAPSPSPAPSISQTASAGVGQIAPVNYVETASVSPSPAPLAPPAPASVAVVDSPALAPVTATAAPARVVPAPAVAGVPKVAPGAVELDVAADSLIATPGFDVPVRVALGYQPRLYMNGVEVDSSRIGERRIDHTSNTEQVTYVGLAPSPGPNALRVVAVSADGAEHSVREVTVFGRGPAVRLVVEPSRAEIPAGRREKTGVVVRAYDAWGHAALDGDIAVQTSAGSFDGPQEAASLDAARAQSAVTRDGQPALVSRPSQLQTERTVKLVGGTATVNLVSADAPGSARLVVTTGDATAQADVRFVTEADAPRIVVGLANVTVGRAAPVMDLRQVDSAARGSLAFFFKGRLWSDNVLTLSYDSQRPLQRFDARDRLFQLDPTQRNYFVFGDASTRFSAAPSNSKLYARLDLGRAWGRSYAMFGDFTPDTRGLELASYNRKLTGVQVHFENSRGDLVSVGGARPNTAFGRDVFPGGSLGLVRLSASLVLPGSETVTLEVRDRRNPDLLIRREPLQRGADYNLDPDAGRLFFIRTIQAFDSSLNLQQIVVTYEYEAQGSATNVYTARVVKKFGEGGSVGLAAAVQGQGNLGNFVLGGFELSQEMPNGGMMRFEYARSSGKVVGVGNFFTSNTSGRNDGEALLATYEQPLKWRHANLQLSFRRASKDFLNPFGSTIVGGAQRAGASLDLQATNTARLRLGFTDERNNTDLVKNSRQTAGFAWTQQLGEKLSGTLAYDFRRLSDSGDGESRDVTSHMLTLGVDYRPTSRLQLSVQREQNLGAADPTYPSQTVLTGSYRINNASRFFVTQRLSNSAITPISDLTGAGFAFSESRREFNAGIETKFLRDTSLVGGYRIENGVDGSDGFAVIGLTQRLKLSEALALNAGYERAFHMTGRRGRGYDNLNFGATWQPRPNFIANSRYQFRNRDGSGHLFAAGFVGKPLQNVTALGQVQYARGSGFGSGADSASRDAQSTSGLYGSFGVALRPVKSDRVAGFFNYQHRSLSQGVGANATRERSSTFSADAFVQAARRVSLFGKFALKDGDTSRPGVPSAATLTYLLQGRVEYLLARRWDVAFEERYLAQPSTRTSRMGAAGEVGFWVTPDVRVAGGYNFNRALEQPGRDALGGNRSGFYFSVSSQLERVFKFFDAQKKKD